MTIDQAEALQSHQDYIQAVAEIALARLPEDERANVQAHITYGAGQPGLHGVTYHNTWQNGEPDPVPFVEICAFGELSDVQLAETVIHELAHVKVGIGHGHDKTWREACAELGLRIAHATSDGRFYMARFTPDVRFAIAALTSPTDGKPVGAHSRGAVIPIPTKPKVCPVGIGTRGGKARGPGSGSRLRKWVCECDPATARAEGRTNIIRASTNDLRAHCDVCGAAFKQA